MFFMLSDKSNPFILFTDIDECSQGLYSCGEHASCQNTVGSYVCYCDSGWEGDGNTCVDIDECERRTVGCHPRALCENNNGSFVCTCPAGFIGDGVTCLGKCRAAYHR